MDLLRGEMAYLASELVEYHFSWVQIYMIPGETMMVESYEEFYPNIETLREKMMVLFYEKMGWQ